MVRSGAVRGVMLYFVQFFSVVKSCNFEGISNMLVFPKSVGD